MTKDNIDGFNNWLKVSGYDEKTCLKHKEYFIPLYNAYMAGMNHQQNKIDKLQEKLKLKTQNEIDASVNADCLDGCRIKLQAAEEKIKELEKDLKDSIHQFEQLVIENEKLKGEK